MAKEAELLSGSYKAIKCVPGAAGVAGEVLTFNEQIGFLIEDITAAEVALSEERTLIVEAEIVKVVKNAAEVWVAGEVIAFDAAAGDFTNVPAALDQVGYAREAAAGADTHGFIVWRGETEYVKT
jgi:hypothetical protein